MKKFEDFPFAERFRQLTKNIDEKELAAFLSVTDNSFRQWKNGHSLPTCDKLLKLSEYFGVSADYLLGKDENKTAENEIIRKITGLYDNAISNLSKITEYDRTLDDGGNIDPLKESDYLNALLGSASFVNLYHEIQQYCAFMSMAKFKEHYKDTFEMSENTGFIGAISNKDLFFLVMNGQLARCEDAAHMLVEEVLLNIGMKLNEIFSDNGGNGNGE